MDNLPEVQKIKMHVNCFWLLIVMFMCGCQSVDMEGVYELVSGVNGKMYRINKQSGDIAVVENDEVRMLSDKDDPLGIMKKNGSSDCNRCDARRHMILSGFIYMPDIRKNYSV